MFSVNDRRRNFFPRSDQVSCRCAAVSRFPCTTFFVKYWVLGSDRVEESTWLARSWNSSEIFLLSRLDDVLRRTSTPLIAPRSTIVEVSSATSTRGPSSSSLPLPGWHREEDRSLESGREKSGRTFSSHYVLMMESA